MILRYQVDRGGRLLGITGPDVTDQLVKLFPEPVSTVLRRMFTREALLAKSKAEWDARYADLIGRELRVGDSFDWTSEFQSPNGATRHTTERNGSGGATCPHGTCVLPDPVCLGVRSRRCTTACEPAA